MVALKQSKMNRGRFGLVFQAFPERTGYLGFSTDEGGFEVVSPGVFQLTAPMISVDRSCCGLSLSVGC